MISSIFNFRNKYYAYVLITFAMASGVLYLAKRLPNYFEPIENLSELITSPDYYLQYNEISLDDYVLFHGLQGTVEQLKKAETLLLGSSRLGYAIQEKIIKRSNPAPYVLAFGHEEMDVFPMKIIEKFNLKPKLIVINVDKFFENKMSKFAGKVAKEGTFPALRSIFEYNTSTLAQNELHKFVPYVSPFFTKREDVLLIRSRVNGTWNFLKEPVIETEMSLASDSSPSEDQIDYARSVVDKLRARGSKVIFILVPNPDTSNLWAEKLASELDVTFWEYPSVHVKTRDGSHVTEAEGMKFTDFLIEKIEQAKEI